MNRAYFLLILGILLLVGCRSSYPDVRRPVPGTQARAEEQVALRKIETLRAEFPEMKGEVVSVKGVVTSVEDDFVTVQDTSGAILLEAPGKATLEQLVIVTGRLTRIKGNLALVDIQELLVEAEQVPFPEPDPLTFAREQENLYVETGPGRFATDGLLRLVSGEWLTVRDGGGVRRVVAGTRVDTVRGVLRRVEDSWELLPTHPRDIITAPPLIAPCEIQGAGFSSPYRGERVETVGVVTAAIQNGPEAGFFLQLPACDGDPGTSDGLYVVVHKRLSLRVGSYVRLRGTVEAFYGRTQLRLERDALVVEDETDAPPAPHLLSPPPGPEAARAYYESLEGMLVRLDEASVVGPTNRYGEASVVPAGTELVNRRLLYRDSVASEPLLVPRHSTFAPSQLVVGDHLYDLTGVLDFTYGHYKIQPVAKPVIEAAPRPQQPNPPRLSGRQWSVATYNVANLVEADNTEENGRSAPQSLTVRLRKLAATIAGPLRLPTIVALQEVENLSVLEQLAEEPGLQGRYDALLLEGIDPRGIDQGLLVDRERVEILDAALANRCSLLTAPGGVPQSNCSTGERLLFARPPMVVKLRLDGAHPFYLMNNHFKSKRGGERTRTRRTAQARFVARLVRQLRQDRPEAEVIVLGDLNDGLESEPLQVLVEEAPLSNLWTTVPPDEHFSYNFNGVSQILDHLLVTAGLEERLIHFTPLRLNADYPHGWLDDPSTPYRTSDHDPLLAVFR